MSRLDKFSEFGPTLPDSAFRKKLGSHAPATLEGGSKGGGAMPSPDPNIGKAQLMLADNAVRQQKWLEDKVLPGFMEEQRAASAISRDVARRQMEQMDFQTGAAREYLDRWRGTQVPLEDTLISEARGYDAEGEAARRGAVAVTDVAQQFGNARGTAMRALTRSGVNPNSGMAISANAGMATSEALARVSAMNQTREAARQLGWAKRMDAAALGRGLPGFSSAAGQIGVGAGQGAAVAGMGGVNSMGSVVSGMNTGFNGVNSAIGAMGDLGVKTYGIQSQNWQNANATDPLNAILGAATGVGTSWVLGRK